MRAALFLAAVALGAVLVAAESDVVDATDANFDTVVASADMVLVEFYAPWCGHCKKLAPEWETAATELKGKAVLAKLDATVEKESGEKYGIKGFPTIKVFQGGVLSSDYEGGRSSADIVKYVKANTGPAVTDVADAAALAAFKAENAVAVIAHLADKDGANGVKFAETAKKLRAKASFALATSAAAAGDIAEGTVVLAKAGEADEVFADFAGDLEQFVLDNAVPVFDEIGPHNYKMYLDRKLPMAWLFCNPTDEESKAQAKASSLEFKGKMSFVWVDAGKFGGMAQRLGLKSEFPALAIDHDGMHYAYPQGEAINTEKLTAFAKQYIAGELEATIRSAEAPAQHTENGLTTVVGTTFKQLVAESDVDVLIEFYAPWCGHCKQLAPIYDELAAKLKDAPIRIAKIDATENDFDQKKFNVQGFPTLYFVPATTHEPTPYEGARTVDGMMAFLKEKATQSL